MYYELWCFGARIRDRAFAVKVVPKRRPVSPFSGFDLYHHFRNDAFYGLCNLLKVQKTGKRVLWCFGALVLWEIGAIGALMNRVIVL